MTLSDPLEELKRTIVLLYGVLDTGGPFWVFVAVRPSRYQDLLKAQKEGGINAETFSYFGEMIISGEGRCPPDEVILKVAEMYQTDAATLARHVEDDARKQQPDAAAGS